MSSLKCPRCKSEIKETDTFCMSCGNPIKADIEKKTKSLKEVKSKDEIEEENVEVVNQVEEVVPSIDVKKDKCNVNILTVVLIVIILILVGALSYFLVIKEEKECDVCKKCPEPEVEIVEKEPTIQYINFEGYRFSMPLDWNFEGDTGEYKFTNEQENLYILISKLDTVQYETFASEEYQKIYIETLQSDYDIFITNKEEKTQNSNTYYILEGTFDSYNYIIVVTENSDGIFLTEAQFENNSVYSSKKQEVVDFALSYIKNDRI